jgi:hypothetical protein
MLDTADKLEPEINAEKPGKPPGFFIGSLFEVQT